MESALFVAYFKSTSFSGLCNTEVVHSNTAQDISHVRLSAFQYP
jgi:hypothetical protein